MDSFLPDPLIFLVVGIFITAHRVSGILKIGDQISMIVEDPLNGDDGTVFRVGGF